MDLELAQNLGENLRRLREQRGLSQQQIARLAKIPRPTWSNLESGEANPTLEVLAKAANALQVRLEELIGPPKHEARLYPAATIKKRQRGPTTIRQLLPEALPGLEIERMELPPGASFAGIPHTAGTREYLTAERGKIELTASGVRFMLETGDVVVFRGDQRHGYRNPTDSIAIAYSVVTFAPV
jgi:XRE family transcriptional regulator, regulator of sulfur utilization